MRLRDLQYLVHYSTSVQIFVDGVLALERKWLNVGRLYDHLLISEITVFNDYLCINLSSEFEE